VRIVTFENAGLAKGTSDINLWECCQQQQVYLLTDNRNQDDSDSLESLIRRRNLSPSLPIFTISDINRFRSHREYAEKVVAKLLEYLFDADNLLGTGRLYLP
jgi:hypothetical protein